MDSRRNIDHNENPYKSLPSLSWFSTPKLTFLRLENPRVTTVFAVTSGKRRPVSSKTLTVNPQLAFAHATHVQSQGFISIRHIEVGLQVEINLNKYVHRWFFLFYESCTLCHANGCCWFCAISEPFVQSTEETVSGETRFMASPLSPT